MDTFEFLYKKFVYMGPNFIGKHTYHLGFQLRLHPWGQPSTLSTLKYAKPRFSSSGPSIWVVSPGQSIWVVSPQNPSD